MIAKVYAKGEVNMAFELYSKDPKKKTIQIVELVIAIIGVIAAVVMLPPVIREYQQVNQAISLHDMGHEYMHQNNIKSAREYYEKALQVYPKLKSTYIELAGTYYFEEDYQKEIDTYRRGLEVMPENADLRHSLIESLFLVGDYDSAIKEAEQALKYDKNDSIAKAFIERCQKIKKDPKYLSEHQREMVFQKQQRMQQNSHVHLEDQNMIISPANSGAPAAPGAPDNTATPAAPGAPDNAAAPAAPGAPDNAAVSAAPGAPDNAAVPAAPGAPDNAAVPATPSNPDNVAAPAK